MDIHSICANAIPPYHTDCLPQGNRGLLKHDWSKEFRLQKEDSFNTKKTKQKNLQPWLQINVHIEICVYSGNGGCLAFGASLKWPGLQSLKTLFSQSVSNN